MLSRRVVLARAAAAGAVSVLAGKAAAQGFTKSPQPAGYQSQPNGSQHCGNCPQFQPPSSCKVVAGKISANGWCRIYAAK